MLSERDTNRAHPLLRKINVVTNEQHHNDIACIDPARKLCQLIPLRVGKDSPVYEMPLRFN
jgi:hypothetical protein